MGGFGSSNDPQNVSCGCIILPVDSFDCRSDAPEIDRRLSLRDYLSAKGKVLFGHDDRRSPGVRLYDIAREDADQL